MSRSFRRYVCISVSISAPVCLMPSAQDTWAVQPSCCSFSHLMGYRRSTSGLQGRSWGVTNESMSLWSLLICRSLLKLDPATFIKVDITLLDHFNVMWTFHIRNLWPVVVFLRHLSHLSDTNSSQSVSSESGTFFTWNRSSPSTLRNPRLRPVWVLSPSWQAPWQAAWWEPHRRFPRCRSLPQFPFPAAGGRLWPHHRQTGSGGI